MPVATSQRRTVLSSDPEARVLPSGLKATLDTASVCPSKARRERAGGDVPEAHRLVIGPGGEGLAIGAEGDARHRIRMSLEGAEGACRWRRPRGARSCHRTRRRGSCHRG